MKAYKIFLLVFLLVFTKAIFAAPNISVTFIMDESWSVSSSNFQLEKKGFIKALDALPNNGSVEISAIGFSSSSQTLVDRTTLDSTTFSSVKTALENNSQNGGGTNMSGAINAAANLLGSSSAPTKIICLATDGSPNSTSRTTTAATNAKNAGIVLSPVGIGLNSSGKTFLDSIASNPPVPNPSNFTEFATVVTNDCVGVVKSALNIQLTPDPVDFGSFNSNTIAEDLKICAKDPKIISVRNESNQPATVTNIEIVGSDASQFELISFMGVDASKLTYPITLSPKVNTEIKVKLKPNATPPADKSYDASVKLSAKDATQTTGEFSTILVAKVDTAFPSCLGLTIIDASPLIQDISATGVPLKKDKKPIGEIDVTLTLQNDKDQKLHREGLVSDGNSRLLLVSQTRQSSGKVRFEIMNPATTEMRLYPLTKAPTYKAQSREYDDQGKTVLDLDIATDPDGFGQITAVLRAGERFLGGNIEKLKHSVKACILDSSDNCTESVDKDPIIEQKAPVLLIHGLWSDNNTWFDDNRSQGMHPRLRSAGFRVDMLTYDGNLGPSETVPKFKKYIEGTIITNCYSIIEHNKLACSRVDIIAHSMGGLFARELIRLNYHNDKDVKVDGGTYLTKNTHSMSFGQGSIRRVVTMATPHFGSPLANVLWADTLFQPLTDEQKKDTSKIPALVTNNAFIDDCIIHPEASIFDSDGGYDEIHDLVDNLGGEGKLVLTGIDNLVVGGVFQNRLNQHRFDASAKIPPLLVIAGDIGQDYDQSLVVGNAAATIGVTTIRFHTIGNAEEAGCDYNRVLVNNSDGIVPVNSARMSTDFLNTYSGLSEYVSAGTANITNTLADFNHTGMGKEHPFINDDREEDDSRETLEMINLVIQQLSTKLQ